MSDQLHMLCLLPVHECRCDGEPHTAEAHAVISAELTACVLGQRQRLELRVDTAGRMLHAIQSGLLHIGPRIDRLMAELRAYRYPA